MKLFFYLVVAPLLILMGFRAAFQYGMLFGYPFWFVASLLWMSPLAAFGARLFCGLFVPGERYSRPQPMYSIPESLRQKNQIAEAMAWYRGIAEEYPQEVKPWVEMVRLAHLEMKDRGLADALKEQGLLHLKKAAAREELKRMHGAITSMRQEAPTAAERKTVAFRTQNSV